MTPRLKSLPFSRSYDPRCGLAARVWIGTAAAWRRCKNEVAKGYLDNLLLPLDADATMYDWPVSGREVLVVNAEVITGDDIRRLMAILLARGAIAAIALRPTADGGPLYTLTDSA